MYYGLLDAILNVMKSEGTLPQLSASVEELTDLDLRAQSELKAPLPEGYAGFLAKVNGLDWNGLVVYAAHRCQMRGRPDLTIEGFIEGNLNYRSFLPMKDYLIIADDGTVLFVYNIAAGKFQVILRVGLSVLDTFDSFSALIFDALKGHWPFPLP